MKKNFLAILIASILLISCNGGSNPTPVTYQSQSEYQQPVNNVTIQPTDIAGFNIQNFAQVIKTTSDPSAIERAINNNSTGINNLDLNKDGNADFLKVVETSNTLQIVDNDVNPAVTICTLNITPQGNSQASMNIQGSPQYCGSYNSYNSNFTVGDFLLLHYLLTPHRYYYPVYTYGYHPAYYHPYHTVTTRTVVTHTYNSPSGNNQVKPYQASPSRGSISNPTKSQRQFQVNTTNTGQARSSGFGKSVSPTPSRSFGTSSSRSFSSGRH